MPTCPNGHQSGSEDWCEVCGHRMAGAGAVPPPPPPPPAPGYGYPPSSGEPTAQAELCPQCRTPREAMAPYCEECRWNFLTNTATSYTPLAPQGGSGGPVPGLNLPPGFQAQPGPPPQQQQQRDPYEYQSSRPSQMNRSAEPLSSEQGGMPGPPPPFQQGPPPPPSFQQQSQQPQSPSPFERQEQQGRQQPFEQQQGPPSFQQQTPSPFEPQQQQQMPSPFEQRSAPPQTQPQTQPPPQTGGDDWILPPPSQAQPPQHQQPPQGFPEPPQSPKPGSGQDQNENPGRNQGQNPGRNQSQDQGHGQYIGQGQNQGRGQDGRNQPPRSWTAVIAPDRDYFLAMMQRSGPEATGLNLPAYSPEQHLPLTGSQITIGRRRHSTGESPDVDLSVPPEDPGVSHQHAVLVQQPDGTWAVVDQNSTNGTTLNGAEEPIQPYVPVPLQDGDRVHVGAWTTITVRCG